jgi:hypothetical protein
MARSFTCDACGTARVVGTHGAWPEGPGAIPDGWWWVMAAQQPRAGGEDTRHACSGECAVEVVAAAVREAERAEVPA